MIVEKQKNICIRLKAEYLCIGGYILFIKKIFNNNVLLVHDSKGLEYIKLGRAIAFGKKVGQLLEEDKVEKTFVIDSPQTMERFAQLINEVPVNQLELVTKIIERAEEELNCKFKQLTYIGLSDHINYAILRARQGMLIKNALLWEIKQFYPKEFAAAMNALEMIKYYESVKLPEDEAGFIALHFVNGQHGETVDKTIIATEIIQKVTVIIEDQLNLHLSEGSLNYMRFITHLRFFIMRTTSEEKRNTEMTPFYLQVSEAYPIATECVEKIVEYLSYKLSCEIYPEEKVYLILHIQRLIK